MNSIQLKPAAQFNLMESGRINLLRRLGWCSKKWSEPLIMETLDLIVEPRELKIYPSPRSPDLPMAEIESSEISSQVS